MRSNRGNFWTVPAAAAAVALSLILIGAAFLYNKDSFSRAGELTAGADELYSGAAGAEPQFVPGQVLVKFKSSPVGAGAKTAAPLSFGALGLEKSLPADVRIKTAKPVFSVSAGGMKAAVLPDKLCLSEDKLLDIMEVKPPFIGTEPSGAPVPSVIPAEAGIQSVDSPIEPEDGGGTSYPRDTTYPDIESEPVIIPDEPSFGAQVLSAIPAKSSRCFSFAGALAGSGGAELQKSAQQLERRREEKQRRLDKARKLEKQFNLDKWYSLTLDLPRSSQRIDASASLLDAISQLSQNPNIESAEPNFIAHALAVPNDPFFSSSGSWGQSYDDLWGIKKIQADQVWIDDNPATWGDGVVVAVVDSGIDYNHPDLKDNIWTNTDEILGNGVDDDGNGFIDDVRGWDFVNGDNDPYDDYGHGSHVAGTIAAVANNGIGVAGVAPRVKLMAVKGLGGGGGGSYSMLAGAVRYAAFNGAKVINNSWGGPPHPLITDAFNTAYGLGVVSVAAAGNGNDDAFKHTPANLPTTITVAASTETDKRTGFSSYGNAVDVAAPGGGETSGCAAGGCNILSTMPDDSLLARNNLPLKVGDSHLGDDGKYHGFWRIRGTSMASPHVAGAAALVLAQHPDFTNEEVRSALKATSDVFPVQPGNYIGQGRVNALSATAVSAPLPIGWLKKIDMAVIGGSVVIRGFAKGNNFAKYELYYGDGENPASWTSFYVSTSSVDGDYNNPGVLGSLDVPTSASGSFTVKLVVTSTASTGGRSVSYQTTFTPACFMKQSIAPVAAPSLRHFFHFVDMDGDRDKDIVSINISRLSWYENRGGQNFVEHVIDADVSPAPGVTINSNINPADLDGDGDLDILVAHSYSIDWYKNDGNQNFVKQRIITRRAAKLVFAADMDKDGDTDIISFYQSPTNHLSRVVVWLENDGNQVFTERVIDALETTTAIFTASDIAAGDLDDDSDIDIVLGSDLNYLKTGGMGSLWLYRNDGSQNFVRININTRDVLAPMRIYSVELVDVDKDGLLDIVAGSRGAGNALNSTIVSWFAAPDFVKNVIDADVTVTTGNPARAADLDGDGDIDIAAVFDRGWPPYIRRVNLYENDGGQRFTSRQIEDLFSADDYVSDLRVADMDGDGINDLLAVSYKNGLIWYKDTCVVPRPNNPPVLSPIGNKTITANSNLSFTLSAADPDGDALTLSSADKPTGSTLDAATGVFSWTPAASQAGDHNVTFTVTDGRGGSDSETITINVQAPVEVLFEDNFNRANSGTLGSSWQDLSGNFGIEDNKAVAKKFGAFTAVKNISTADVEVSADVNLLRSSAQAGLILRQNNGMRDRYLGWLTRSGNFMDFKIAKYFNGAFSMVARQWFPLADVSTAGKLSLGINGGALTMSFGGKTLIGNDNNPLSAGSVGMYSVRFYGPAYSTLDNFGAVSAGEPLPNNPPILSPIGNKIVTAGNSLSFTISATDSDNDPLTYSATGLPTGATFVAATRTFSWTPVSSQTGDHNVTFTVTDGKGGSDSETITIDVQAPVAIRPAVMVSNPSSSVLTTGEVELLRFTVAADVNGDVEWGVIEANVSINNATLTSNSLKIRYTGNDLSLVTNLISVGGGEAVMRLAAPQYIVAGSSKTYSLFVTVASMAGGSTPASISTNLKLDEASSDPPNSLLVQASDGDSFIWSDLSRPPHSTNSLDWYNGYGIVGLPSVVKTLTKSMPVNNDPVLSSIGNETVTAGNNLSFTISATDPDGDALTYSAAGLPTGATFNSTTRTFSWTPAASQAGDHNVTFTVTDGKGGSDSETITISVQAPVAETLFEDDFNRPDSPNLGVNWRPRRDSISIKNNKAVGSFGFPAVTVDQLSVGNVVTRVGVDVSQLEGLEEVGLIARCRESSGNCSNHYFGRIKRPTVGSATMAIYKFVNSTSYALTNEAVVPAETGTLRFQANGNALTLSFGGVTLTANDSSHPNAGYVGIKMRSHGSVDLAVDDFRAE